MNYKEWLDLIPEQIVKRGEKLKDHITDLILKEDKILAQVKGNYQPYYRVEVKFKEEEIESWECDCPYDGEVCKHVVAAVLKAFEPESKKGTKRKGKIESALEIVEKLSEDELRSLLKELAYEDMAVRNMLLARFPHYVSSGPFSLESIYRDIVNKLIQGYKKQGFIGYYECMDLARNLSDLLRTGENFVQQGKLEPAFSIAKAVLQGLTRAMNSMDDSSGSTGVVLAEAFGLLVNIYRAGKEDVFDFLLGEIKKKAYRDFDLHYDIAEALVEMADSPKKAKKILKLIEKLKYGHELKATLLAKFFPEEYEKFVWDEKNILKVWELHLEKLQEENRLDEALRYLDHVLSHHELSTYRKLDVLEIKAEILEALGRLKEALVLYRKLFDNTLESRFLPKIKEFASDEEWAEVSQLAREKLKGLEFLEFLLEEKDFEAALELLKSGKVTPSDAYSLKDLFELSQEFPENLRKEAFLTVLSSSLSVIKEASSRDKYRAYLKALKPYLKTEYKEQVKNFILKLKKLFPQRRALHDEIDKVLKKV